MIELPKRGMRVWFRPPENAYSPRSLQHSVSGLDGILEDWNGTQARVLFFVEEQNLKVNVNADYIYAEDIAPSPSSLRTLFRGR